MGIDWLSNRRTRHHLDVVFALSNTSPTIESFHATETDLKGLDENIHVSWAIMHVAVEEAEGVVCQSCIARSAPRRVCLDPFR